MECLNKDVLSYLLEFLCVCDILRLGRTSRRFYHDANISVWRTMISEAVANPRYVPYMETLLKKLARRHEFDLLGVLEGRYYNAMEYDDTSAFCCFWEIYAKAALKNNDVELAEYARKLGDNWYIDKAVYREGLELAYRLGKRNFMLKHILNDDAARCLHWVDEGENWEKWQLQQRNPEKKKRKI